MASFHIFANLLIVWILLSASVFSLLKYVGLVGMDKENPALQQKVREERFF